MGLFDVFDSGGGRRSARQQNDSLQEAYNMANQRLDQYAGAERDVLKQGRSDAYGYLDAGVSQAQPWLEKSITPFQGLYDRGTQGIDYYGQLVGLGGGDPAGMQQTLENIPGYQFARDQGIQALDRQANAKGNPYNATDVLNFTNGLASQNYFNYLDRLNPFFGLAQGAASGLAGGYGNIANLYNQLGANKANVATGVAGSIADTYRNQGTGNMNLALGRGQANADMYANNYAADQAASQNLWGAILSGLTAGIGAI